MSDTNKDPSLLYDEEFMKKREQMFGENAEYSEVESGRENLFDDEEEEEDAFEEKGLFSFLRRSKNKKSRKKSRYDDDDDDDDGYDILMLEELEKKEEAEAEKSQPEKKESEDKKQAQKKEEKKKEENSPKEKSASASQKAQKVNSEKPKAKKDLKQSKKETASFEKETEEKVQVQEEKDTQKTKEQEKIIEEIEQDQEDFSAEKAMLENLDDINALLESVGIKPLSSDDVGIESENKNENENAAEDEDVKIAEFESVDNNDSKEDKSRTRHFSFAKAAQETASKVKNSDTKVLGSFYKSKKDGYSEEEIEENLKSSRKNLIDNFRVLAKNTGDRAIFERETDGKKSSITESIETKDGEGIFDAVDRMSKKVGSIFSKKSLKEKRKEQVLNAQTLAKEIKTIKNKKSKSIIFTIVLTVLMLILTVLVGVYTEGGALEFLFGNGARFYSGVSLGLLVLCIIGALPLFSKAVESISEKRFDENTALLLLTLCTAVHSIAALIGGLDEETGYDLYCCVAAFFILILQFSELCTLDTVSKNLSIVMRSPALIGLQSVLNKSDAAALGYGIAGENDTEIFYACDCENVEQPLEIAQRKTADKKFYTLSLALSLGVSIVFAAILSIVYKDAFLFFSVFAGSICLLTPIFRKAVSVKLREDTNAELASFGAMVMSFDSCEKIGNSHAVVLDVADLFEAGVSKFRSVASSKITQNDAVVFAAATLKNTRSIIRNCFDSFLEQNQINLPEAEDLQYEDRLGYSSWVAGRRVLVGTREMLKAHSIDCPTQEEEMRYSKGRNVLYVVVEGVIVATFLVTYSPKVEARKSILNFNKTGLILMINSAEPGLEENLLASKLGTDIASVKIISTKGAEIISAYKSNPNTKENNGLLCSKKQRSIMQLINASFGLYSADKISLVMSVLALVINFIALVLCSALRVSSTFTALTVIIMQTLWAFASYFVAKSKIK